MNTTVARVLIAGAAGSTALGAVLGGVFVIVSGAVGSGFLLFLLLMSAIGGAVVGAVAFVCGAGAFAAVMKVRPRGAAPRVVGAVAAGIAAGAALWLTAGPYLASSVAITMTTAVLAAGAAALAVPRLRAFCMSSSN